jgi:hypothetical protein
MVLSGPVDAKKVLSHKSRAEVALAQPAIWRASRMERTAGVHLVMYSDELRSALFWLAVKNA